ncbi:unnamed protein product [Phytophthora fragariaefolia]|uniref:Unnamed protein product n=1 Tax=Phytophthora fragariaefolia TaxID=1490495 RepID=A0A9W6YNH3_9STRA|nr:unnamed protein product [Phytophthora fragariaefolia]GMF88847.1 unnamed protein product [Phytophthora fragariaefolia]
MPSYHLVTSLGDRFWCQANSDIMALPVRAIVKFQERARQQKNQTLTRCRLVAPAFTIKTLLVPIPPLVPLGPKGSSALSVIMQTAATIGGAHESDNEPSPVLVRKGEGNDADEGAGMSEGEIDLRNTKMNQFIGEVSLGTYDSDARDWWEQFAD